MHYNQELSRATSKNSFQSLGLYLYNYIESTLIYYTSFYKSSLFMSFSFKISSPMRFVSSPSISRTLFSIML